MKTIIQMLAIVLVSNAAYAWDYEVTLLSEAERFLAEKGAELTPEDRELVLRYIAAVEREYEELEAILLAAEAMGEVLGGDSERLSSKLGTSPDEAIRNVLELPTPELKAMLQLNVGLPLGQYLDLVQDMDRVQLEQLIANENTPREIVAGMKLALSQFTLEDLFEAFGTNPNHLHPILESCHKLTEGSPNQLDHFLDGILDANRELGASVQGEGGEDFFDFYYVELQKDRPTSPKPSLLTDIGTLRAYCSEQLSRPQIYVDHLQAFGASARVISNGYDIGLGITEAERIVEGATP